MLVWKTNFDSIDHEGKLGAKRRTLETAPPHTHNPPPFSHMTKKQDPTHHLNVKQSPVDRVTPPPNVVNVGPRLFHRSSPNYTDLTQHQASPAHATNGSAPPTSQTAPLEEMTMSPQLAATLEHIVGQLDILTQVQ